MMLRQDVKPGSFSGIVAMGFLPIALPLLVLLVLWDSEQKNNLFEFEHLMLSLHLIPVEIILIYFFRVILHNYKTVKTQIIQIELRQALCQFIQSYAKYSVDITKDNPGVLAKFENLIFSGIMEGAEKTPWAYDIFENIKDIIKLFKSTKS